MTRYTTANGLPDYDITACWRDLEGNLWFGGRTNGLAKLSDHKVYRFPLSGLRPDVMNHAAVTDARGRIFVVSETGIWEIWRNQYCFAVQNFALYRYIVSYLLSKSPQ